LLTNLLMSFFNRHGAACVHIVDSPIERLFGHAKLKLFMGAHVQNLDVRAANISLANDVDTKPFEMVIPFLLAWMRG